MIFISITFGFNPTVQKITAILNLGRLRTEFYQKFNNNDALEYLLLLLSNRKASDKTATSSSKPESELSYIATPRTDQSRPLTDTQES